MVYLYPQWIKLYNGLTNHEWTTLQKYTICDIIFWSYGFLSMETSSIIYLYIFERKYGSLTDVCMKRKSELFSIYHSFFFPNFLFVYQIWIFFVPMYQRYQWVCVVYVYRAFEKSTKHKISYSFWQKLKYIWKERKETQHKADEKRKRNRVKKKDDDDDEQLKWIEYWVKQNTSI